MESQDTLDRLLQTFLQQQQLPDQYSQLVMDWYLPLAADIVAYREQQGGFSSVDELVQVKGVGSKTLEKLRRLVYVK